MNDCFTVKSFCKALYLGVFFFRCTPSKVRFFVLEMV